MIIILQSDSQDPFHRYDSPNQSSDKAKNLSEPVDYIQKLFL